MTDTGGPPLAYWGGPLADTGIPLANTKGPVTITSGHLAKMEKPHVRFRRSSGEFRSSVRRTIPLAEKETGGSLDSTGSPLADSNFPCAMQEVICRHRRPPG